MHTLTVRNANQAWYQGCGLLHSLGLLEGDDLVLLDPVCVIIDKPQERLLFCPHLNANPFFDLFHAAWSLAGRSDARWLDQFNPSFSRHHAETSGQMHGSPGVRWRRNFLLHPDGIVTRDQIAIVSRQLRDDPNTSKAVLTMWDPPRDLGLRYKSHPNATHCCFKARKSGSLDMMVSCCSYDVIAPDIVLFSILQEYIAALAGMQIGKMWHVSWSWHAQADVFNQLIERDIEQQQQYELGEAISEPLFTAEHAEYVWDELDDWMEKPLEYKSIDNQALFSDLLSPMFAVHHAWQHAGDNGTMALEMCQMIRHTDWQMAAKHWISRQVLARTALEPEVS